MIEINKMIFCLFFFFIETPSTGSHQMHLVHNAQSKPIKISGNESTKSSSSSTSAGSSADSTERLILSKQNTIIKGTPPTAITTAITSGGSASSVASTTGDNSDFHYESIIEQNVTKPKFAYHDEPHSFENSMEFLEDYKNFQYEVLETTV